MGVIHGLSPKGALFYVLYSNRAPGLQPIHSFVHRNVETIQYLVRVITLLRLHAPLIHVFDHPRRVHVFRQKTLDEGGY